MLNPESLPHLLNEGVVLDESEGKVGKVGQIFLDDESGNAEWVTVTTGLFGGSETFIPVRDGVSSGSEIRVPYSKDKIKDAPRMDDVDGHLSPEQEQELYTYYGLGDTTDTDVISDHGDTGRGDVDTRGNVDRGFGNGDTDTRGQVDRGFGNDDSPANGTDGDASMVRSEEQVRIGKEKVATGKARLRKYVVTENVTTTVPVEREVVRLEREPITDENRGEAMIGGDIEDGEQEIVLTEERVVVTKETVPVERVSLDTETVTEDQQVTEEVRKEQIEADLPDEADGQSNQR